MFIVEVLELRVMFVLFLMSHGGIPNEVGPVIVQVPVPMLSVLVFEVFEEKLTVETLKFAASNVPCVSVTLPPDTSNDSASASVTVIPEPFIIRLSRDLPAVVSVPDARNVGKTDE